MAKSKAKKTPGGGKQTSQSPRTSKAYRTFERVIERSLNLLSLQQTLDELQTNSPQKLDLSDLSRSAVMLAVAAMDAYFTDVFAENLVRYLKRNKGPNKDLTALLFKAGLDTAKALQLLATDRPYRRIRSLIEFHLEGYTTQKTKAINDLFLAYGMKQFCQNVEKSTDRKTLLASIRKLTERRHQIVHGGDTNAHGKLQDIDHKKVRRRVGNVVKFVAASEELLKKAMS